MGRDRARLTSANPTDFIPEWVRRGGPDSGHYGHAGIPGHRGGSLPGEATSEDERAYGVHSTVSRLAKAIRSKGGVVMVKPGDARAIREYLLARLKKAEPTTAEHLFDRQLRITMSEIANEWDAAGGPMAARYAVPMLEAYERLLDAGKFGDDPPMLWLRDTITEDEALRAQREHPRAARWVVRDDYQAKYRPNMHGIVFVPYQSLSSNEEFNSSEFQKWLDQPPVPMDASGIDAPTFVDMHYANRLEGVLLHEYGHERDWTMTSGIGEARKLMGRPDLLQEHISFYAGETPNEAMAETYALLQHPDYEQATPEAKAIVEYLWRGKPLPDVFR